MQNIPTKALFKPIKCLNFTSNSILLLNVEWTIMSVLISFQVLTNRASPLIHWIRWIHLCVICKDIKSQLHTGLSLALKDRAGQRVKKSCFKLCNKLSYVKNALYTNDKKFIDHAMGQDSVTIAIRQYT